MSKEYTGGSVSYYRVQVSHPTSADLPPYEAECNDIIEALGMNYAEGNAFKAIWRKCAARYLGLSKEGYKDGLYDSEKVEFFGGRMKAQELNARSSISAFEEELYCGEEPAASIDDESPRAQAIGQNGNTGEHYDSLSEPKPDWEESPYWATHLMEMKGSYEWAMFSNGEYYDGGDPDECCEFIVDPDSAECFWTIVEARPCQ